eukprot:8494-Heterococcus_DN1.PRE.5
MNAEADAANSRKGKQKKRKIAATAAAVAAAADVSDHDDNDDVDVDAHDDNNSVTNDNNSTFDATASNDTQGCIYAYTVPTDGGNSSGKTLYSIGAHNTCDPIDHLESTVDTTETGMY